MIQELVEFGKRVAWGHERALAKEFCSLIISIDKNGAFGGFIPFDKEIEAEVLVKYDKGPKWGYLSYKKGQSRFLLDKREEVLGIGDKDAEKKHKMFIEKLQQYQHIEELKPVFLFYDEKNLNGLKKAVESFNNLNLKKKESESVTLTFMVGTTLLLDIENVRTAIITRFHQTENNLLLKIRNKRNCTICGRSDTPVLDEPYGLVKMPKGQTAGCALVSFNKPAFESYGLKGNLNASICRDCARNLTEGLSFMLSEGHMVPQDENKKRKEHYQYKHRLNISDNTLVLFWTRDKTDDEDGFDILDEPDEENVRKLLESAWSGDHRLGTIVDNNMFYSCTMSSAAARIAVRDWTAISLDEYKRNIADWFRDIEIQDREGTTLYSPLRFLVNATLRDKKPGEKQKSDLNSKARIGSVLWNAAIKGRKYKLPTEVLQYVLNRIFIGDEFSSERAAILKLIINRNTKNEMKSTLDESNTSVAYLCGRLFAVIESMQWRAMGNVNSGVKERYFAAAASQPAFVFGTLLTKNVTIYQRKIGGYLAKELNEIAGKISEMGSFPLRFSTIEQGEFALGYYFQKNHKKDNETTEDTNS
ncbi:MAG: type I-C CRISPR-associated protein Cas8c/Csd1 [Bacteroidales bacterium]|nr:type I-C CRISPR-associated protein Cas8c/Csd1 [Bacteroidales bacterium]